MVWLRIATRLVLVQLTMAALSLLGLVLLGTAPAATAAAAVVGPVRRDEDLPVVRTMWGVWRESLLRSNLAAAPAGLLAAAKYFADAGQRAACFCCAGTGAAVLAAALLRIALLRGN